MKKYSTAKITDKYSEVIYRKKTFVTCEDDESLEILSPENDETESFVKHSLKTYPQVTTSDGVVHNEVINLIVRPDPIMDRMQTRSVLLRPWVLDGHGEINNLKGIYSVKKGLIESGLTTKIQHEFESDSTIIGIDTFIYPTVQDEVLALEGKDHRAFKIIGVDGNEIHSGDLIVSMQHSEWEWELIKSGAFTGYSLGYFAYHFDSEIMPIPNISSIEIDLREIDSLKEV